MCRSGKVFGQCSECGDDLMCRDLLDYGLCNEHASALWVEDPDDELLQQRSDDYLSQRDVPAVVGADFAASLDVRAHEDTGYRLPWVED